MQATILDTPAQIARFALASLRGRLRLEIVGMKGRGPSALSILKKNYGYKGSAQKVLDALHAHLEATK